ncbi:tumor protein p63-regulated gene 1-like protein isoform X1 [Hetaerina americana]|uniref:tumor protein p63-regulated gene 1-like protein isoform X1 n=1 Tax=Hetaerina americana TaxID=62018 RepID=UPI003A7F4395
MTECKYGGDDHVSKDNENLSTMDDTLLDEEGTHDDFQGATLQIRSDPYYLSSRSPSPKVETPKTAGNMQVAPSALPFNSVENARDFFSFRSGLVDNAIEECLKTIVFPDKDGEILGCWLLTEISFWDAEKERLVILTTHSLITVKYDFIALRQLDCRAVPLRLIDTLVTGELVYPPASLVPRMNGLASGVLTVVKGCLLRPLQQKWSKEKSTSDCHLSNNSSSPYDLISSFEPRSRNTRGVRALWNRGAPISFGRRWNPFNSDIPFVTYTFHPLYWARQKQREVLDSNDPFLDDKTYDLDDFSEKLISAVCKENAEALKMGNSPKLDECKEAVEESKGTVENSSDYSPTLNNVVPVKVEQCPIVLQSYVGLGSLIHNRNGLGFFKVRGKFSF